VQTTRRVTSIAGKVSVPPLHRFADGCRSRFLGGSSNCWGGWCRPLEDFDFASRPWVPYSGWPFSKSELEPYYERSHAILRLGPKTFETDYWVDAIGRGDVQTAAFDERAGR